MLARDLDPVATADTAKDLIGVSVGVNAAFLTLYFSLTLLVLTVASSNLGVRLVDRWLDKRLARLTLAFLGFTLLFTLAALAAIDGEADKADLPVAVVAAVILLQAVNVVLLTVALHDLGRTIFVDRAIHSLGRDAADDPARVVPAALKDRPFAMRVNARREGYVEGCDLTLLRGLTGAAGGRVRVCAAPGQHVLAGEPVLMVEHDLAGHVPVERLQRAVPIGPYRSDGQGAVFRVRLLVEIAARALSPAINDFYTALACTDRLGLAMAAHRCNWVDSTAMPVWIGMPPSNCPGRISTACSTIRSTPFARRPANIHRWRSG